MSATMDRLFKRQFETRKQQLEADRRARNSQASKKVKKSRREIEAE